MATQQEIELSKAFGGTGTLTAQQQQAVDTARSAFAPPNINDTKGSTFVPDFSLNPPTTPNTSGVIADANALTNNQLLTSEQYRKLAPQQKTQQKDSLIGNILSKTENKNTVGYMQELQQMQSDFLASKGYTQETFNQLNNFASQAQSLSNDLQRLNLEEKERIYQATGGFQLSGIKGAAENQIRREMAIQKAEVAYNLSVVTGQANLLQGQIDKANSLFEQALNYATAKEAQDVADWKFALEFYTDLDKEDRDYVQQQFENSLAIEANKRANAQLELDQMKANYDMSGGGTGLSPSLFWSAINAGKNELQQGEPWGNVWNRIKSQFPNASNQEIDNALGISWRLPGAYQSFKDKTMQTITPEQEADILFKEGISNLKSEGKSKSEIESQYRKENNIEIIPEEDQKIIDEIYKKGFWGTVVSPIYDTADKKFFWQ